MIDKTKERFGHPCECVLAMSLLDQRTQNFILGLTYESELPLGFNCSTMLIDGRDV